MLLYIQININIKIIKIIRVDRYNLIYLYFYVKILMINLMIYLLYDQLLFPIHLYNKDLLF